MNGSELNPTLPKLHVLGDLNSIIPLGEFYLLTPVIIQWYEGSQDLTGHRKMVF